MKLTIHTDGGCRDNSAVDPGPASCAFVAYDENGRYLACMNQTLVGTNNVAEYWGVMLAVRSLATIEAFIKEPIELIEFKADSELLVNQLSGNWRIKDKTLANLALQIHNGLKGYNRFFTILGIPGVMKPREQNKEADYLCNLALDGTIVEDMFGPLPTKAARHHGPTVGQLFLAGQLHEPKPLRVDTEGYALCNGCKSRLIRCKCPPLEIAA
jgi:ribonuclease HI